MKHLSFKASLIIASVISLLASQVFAADINNGRALVEKSACISCHGADLKSPIAPAYPKIAGQHQDYLYYALKSYQGSNSPYVGRSNAIMGAQAKAFTLSELKDIAAYVSSLPGDLVIKK